MACRNFSLHKKNIVNFTLVALVVTEGYHILLSPLNRSVRRHFIMFRMYIIGTSWEDNQQKGSVASVNRAGVLSPSEGNLGDGAP